MIHIILFLAGFLFCPMSKDEGSVSSDPIQYEEIDSDAGSSDVSDSRYGNPEWPIVVMPKGKVRIKLFTPGGNTYYDKYDDGRVASLPEIEVERNVTFEQLNMAVWEALEKANVTLPTLPWKAYKIPKNLLPGLNLQAREMRLPRQFGALITFDDANLCFNPFNHSSELPDELRIRPSVNLGSEFDKLEQEIKEHPEIPENNEFGNPKSEYYPLTLNLVFTPELKNVARDEIERVMYKSPLIQVDDQGNFMGVLILKEERADLPGEHSVFYSASAFLGTITADFHDIAKIIKRIWDKRLRLNSLDAYQSLLEVFYAFGVIKDVSPRDFAGVFMRRRLFNHIPSVTLEEAQGLILDQGQFLTYQRVFGTRDINLRNIWTGFLNVENDVDLNCSTKYGHCTPYCRSIEELKNILFILLHLSETGNVGFRFTTPNGEPEAMVDYSAPPRTVRLCKTANNISVIAVVDNLPPDATSENQRKIVACAPELQEVTLDNIDGII